MASPKKLFIKTYGCQMNVYDSERMSGALQAAGYESTTSPDMTRTSSYAEHLPHPRKSSRKDLLRIGPYQGTPGRENPELKIGVTGCVAQAEGEHIIERQPAVDLVVGPQAYHRLPDMLAKVENGDRAVDTDFPEEDKFDHLPKRSNANQAPTAFLTVQEGCDKFCALSALSPTLRGTEVSRPAGRLMTEARNLVEQGVAEITLLGQNVNAYSRAGPDGDWSLGRLIRELAKIDGLHRIRFTTSHPNDMSDDLIAAHGEVEKLMPYLHLPVQSGSDKILKAMNRRHTADQYLGIIDRIREVRPDIAMSGDFIVGFPGETDADFQATLDLCDAVKYASAFSFKYSERPGTPAAERPQVAEDMKSDRLARLQEQLTAHHDEFQSKMVGRDLPVLLEKSGRNPGQLVGRSPYLQAVHLDAEQADLGTIVTARIIGTGTNSLAGQRV